MSEERSPGQARDTTQEMIDRVRDWPTISPGDRSRTVAALRGATGNVNSDHVGAASAMDPGSEK